ncbi:SDR family NAD(P)-dependent oxidoreductase [Nocardia speluncae]|uniref:SDR family NAD(P)-dependent oxidoreductase n=1 Tax=Nocardia speluncae TaxID=419477 RepID=A0A846XHJ7_9NOCA|nr:SDR family NAD(P)-dependent oxidoreductase [Nocardia speluncae]NKY34180.1 SDR family NAD(P)-dependent oxidoreductase [Nocardia speluncae]
MGSLDGRVALITGAGRGIGRAEALYLAGEGAKVVVNDPGVAPDGSGGDVSVAASVAEEIRERGGEAVASTHSVAEWYAAAALIQTAVDNFGDLHIVVNNAAVSRPSSLVSASEEAFDAVVAVKLKGTFNVSHWSADYWRGRYETGDRQDRSLVNTTSTAGLDSPLPLNTSYAAANAGVAAMTIVHALELVRYGVRVNAISPGARTRLSLDLPAGVPSLTQHTPAPGEYDPWDPIHQAVVVAYLGRASTVVTGQVLTVRGSTVIPTNTWSLGAPVTKEGAGWDVEELANALGEVPFADPFDRLTFLRRVYGVSTRDEIQDLLNSILDTDLAETANP